MQKAWQQGRERWLAWLAARDQPLPDPSVPWSYLGGGAYFYNLQREHAQQQLHCVPAQEMLLSIQLVIQGPGLYRIAAQRGPRPVELWLFPQQNPKYLVLGDLLGLFEQTSVLALCRASPTDGNVLFLIDIKRFA